MDNLILEQRVNILIKLEHTYTNYMLKFQDLYLSYLCENNKEKAEEANLAAIKMKMCYIDPINDMLTAEGVVDCKPYIKKDEFNGVTDIGIKVTMKSGQEIIVMV